MASGHFLTATAAALLDLGMWAVVVVCQHAASRTRDRAREHLVILDFWFGSTGAPIGGIVAAAMVSLLVVSNPTDFGTATGLGAIVFVVALLNTILLAKYWAWGPVIKKLPNIDIKDDGGLSGVGRLHFVYALIHFVIGWTLVAWAIVVTGWTWYHTVAGCGYCLVATTVRLDIRNGIQLIPDATFVPYLLRQKIWRS